jgi:hypothetical protein
VANKQDYLAQKEKNKQKKLSAGLVADSFPKISRIVIEMTYYQKLSDKVFMLRTVNFTPSSQAYFHIECLTKDCFKGGFEFTPLISDLVKKRKTSGSGMLVCKGTKDYHARGHVSIAYNISIKYNNRSR